MKDGTDVMTPEAVQNRENFLSAVGMPPETATTFYATFDTDDFCRYHVASSGVQAGIDACVTSDANHAILVPLADCTGAVLYDPDHDVLMVSHLGRHSTEQFGGIKSVEYLQTQYDTNPSRLLVWLSPSPNQTAYPLWKFDHKSFRDVLTTQLQDAGVNAANIEVSNIDTATDHEYYSHSEFLKGNRQTDGRYAIAAMRIA